MADLVTYASTPTTTCRRCGAVVGLVSLWGEQRWAHEVSTTHVPDPDLPDFDDRADVERWLATPEHVFPPPF